MKSRTIFCSICDGRIAIAITAQALPPLICNHCEMTITLLEDIIAMKSDELLSARVEQLQRLPICATSDAANTRHAVIAFVHENYLSRRC